jgi:hypothetical protein
LRDQVLDRRAEDHLAIVPAKPDTARSA